MLGKKLIKSNDAGAGACTNTVDLYNPFPDGGGVALYQLNGDATDVSGNYDGTATDVTYGAGQVGQAGVFNGSSSLIELGTNSFSFTEVTVSMWVKFDSFTGEDCLFDGYYEAASVAYGYVCLSDSNNKVKFRSYNYPNYTDTVSTTTLSTGVWYHLAFVSNQSQASVYINGVLDATGSIVGISTNVNTRFTLGAFRYAGGTVNYFDGLIDQVRIFSRALRPYEVEALYTEEYCTPTIVPSEHFNTVVYSGNASTNPITGVGFEPDFTWIKCRTVSGESHWLTDSVRGEQKSLSSNQTIAEQNITNGLVSFDPDGFTLGSYTAFNSTSGGGDNMVSWNFKAGGAAVENTNGTITSQVSANTEAGFSIVSFNGSTGSWTAGHGLNDAPKMVIYKNRDISNAWAVWVEGFTDKDTLYLNLTNEKTSAGITLHGSIPTSTTIGCSSWLANSGDRIIAYCFAEVEGFSNFGSYVGTGASGNTVVTGFEPAFVMFKRTSSDASGGNWIIKDNKRDVSNPNTKNLYANLSAAEEDFYPVDFLENGFQINSSDVDINKSGGSYIYMAFAADPTAVEPTLEDSFNTVVYSGDGSTNNTVTGVGFQPDLVWIKQRNGSASHSLQDSVRGAGQNFNLYSDNTAYEGQYGIYGYLSSFDINGFTVNAASGSHTNASGTDNYVAWNWKGAEIPAINSNGSITSVVSANPAAGFSIVSYTANGTDGASVGHGLDSAPKMIIYKGRNAVGDWIVLTTAIDGSADYLFLNTTAAKGDYPSNYIPTDNLFYSISSSSTLQFIAYCFAEVAGFSKFGSYTGDTPNKVTITTEFEPAFVLFKRTDLPEYWILIDNVRDTKTNKDLYLIPNISQQEDALGAGNSVEFLPNGFEITGAGNYWNASGSTYIYMAFANQF